jgi:hypothetical protein
MLRFGPTRASSCGAAAAAAITTTVLVLPLAVRPAASASTTDGDRPASSSAPIAVGASPPVGRPVARAPVRRILSWPVGETAGGGSVSWSTRSVRHTSFRQSTGWWGAASTRIKIWASTAPHVYAFRMRLPRHVTLSTNRFGEVVARRHAHRVGMLARPWAKDPRGHHHRTWYTARGHVVTQHVAFGRHARFPITADPWWNPVTWQWGEAFSVAWKQVTRCGKGAANAVLSIGGTTGVTNILLKHVAGRAALMIPGGGYTYAGFAAWGCIGSFF